MTHTQQQFGQLLEPYGPSVPVERLVLELNKLYHQREAAGYDRSHPEISRQLPRLWEQMLGRALELAPARPWRVLDFGCGTGFEAEQLLRFVGAGKIAEMVCYDLSPQMLERCSRRLAGSDVPIRFTSRLGDTHAPQRPFDVVLTNSLLHHLPDPLETARQWLGATTDHAVWLAGHEPSSRYYRNAACREVFEQYQRYRSWSKYLSPAAYVGRARRALRLDPDPASGTASEAWRSGLFARRPPALLISRLVDFHVAHSQHEVDAGRGFDFKGLAAALAPDWNLDWFESYAFLGPFFESSLPAAWQRKARDLAGRFPTDGANFCSLWRRAKA